MTDARYAFESEVERRRTRHDAEKEARVLLTRMKIIGVPGAWEPKEDEDGWHAAIDFAEHALLSIGWYERRIASLKKRQRLFTGITVAIVPAGLALALASLVGAAMVAEPTEGLGGVATLLSNLTAAQIGVGFAAVLGFLEFTAHAADQRRNLASFWEASAGLKELAYDLEHRFELDELFTEDGKVSPAVLDAFRESTGQARAIVKAETQAWFENLADPAEMIEKARDVISSVRGESENVTEARRGVRERVEDQERSRKDALRTWEKVKLRHTRAAARVALLEQDDPNGQLEDARSDLERAIEELQEADVDLRYDSPADYHRLVLGSR